MYRVVDAVVVRAATQPAGADPAGWPDLTGSTQDHVRQWRDWLEQIWANAWLADAVEVASPVLARQVSEVIDGSCLDPRQTRRIVMSVARYVLRAAYRATPFGMFAGISAAAFGDQPMVRWGNDHHVVVQPAAEWIAATVTSLESCQDLLNRLPVAASNACIVRGGRLVAAAQQHIGNGDFTGQGRPVEVSVRHTKAAEAALRHARSPITLADLAARLAACFPDAPGSVITAMLAELVRLRLLVTSLRAPMTVTDALGNLADELAAARADSIPQIAGQVQILRTIRDQVSQHNRARSAEARRETRARLAGLLRQNGCASEPLLTVGTRLDAEIVLPQTVAREAETAAGALARLTPYPSGLPAWAGYHAAFIDRYGPGALVPVLEVTDPDTGLGLPATFHGSARKAPGMPASDRNERLIALACQTVIGGGDEIILDDQAISDLAGTGGNPAQVPPHVELLVQVHAPSTAALARGEFTLLVTGASRAAGTTTGRFLDLLDQADRQRISRAYVGLAVL